MAVLEGTQTRSKVEHLGGGIVQNGKLVDEQILIKITLLQAVCFRLPAHGPDCSSSPFTLLPIRGQGPYRFPRQ